MAKQKMRTVDMSVSEEDLRQIDMEKETEAKRLKELQAEEKAEKTAKKEAKVEAKAEIQEKIEAKKEANVTEVKPSKTAKKVRSKHYQVGRRLVDRTKAYDLKKAVELVKKTSYTHFPGTVVADLIVKDDKVSADVRFPHSTGRSVRVAIASEDLLKDIDAGKLDFDILLTTPQLMPKLAKYARTLGPKGLMPNPKNQTIVADPAKRKAELEGGKTTVKTEKKSPLMHVTLGKTTQPDKELIGNTEALINAVGGKKIVKLVLSATMSPGIKVDLTPYQTT